MGPSLLELWNVTLLVIFFRLFPCELRESLRRLYPSNWLYSSYTLYSSNRLYSSCIMNTQNEHQLWNCFEYKWWFKWVIYIRILKMCFFVNALLWRAIIVRSYSWSQFTLSFSFVPSSTKSCFNSSLTSESESSCGH